MGGKTKQNETVKNDFKNSFFFFHAHSCDRVAPAIITLYRVRRKCRLERNGSKKLCSGNTDLLARASEYDPHANNRAVFDSAIFVK